MRVIELDANRFDEFSISHIYTSFYQTSSYCELMEKQGFKGLYLGMVDDNNNILCASLFIIESKKGIIGNLNYAYAPRGFLIDYTDIYLLTEYTKALKFVLNKKGIAFVRIDPPIIYKEHNKYGEVIKGVDNSNLVVTLQALGYEHLGFNKLFEGLKPRWNAIGEFNTSSKKFFTSLKKETRNRIRKAEKLGLEILESDRNSIPQFYKFVETKHIRNLEYYRDFYDIFNESDMFHIYFAKLNPFIYLQNSKRLFEKEQIINSKIIIKMAKQKNNMSLINKKMESDKLLAIYKNDVVRATNLSTVYPKGILVGTNAVVVYKNEVLFLIDGYDKNFENIPANYLLKWKIIENYINKGYKIFNFNGITGNFTKDNKYYGLYKFKTSFNTDVVEYIGEFDLIINAALYQMYTTIPSLQLYLKK